MLVKDISHDELAEVGAKWLKNNGFKYTFSNMRSMTHGEQPDALGINASGETFLIEVKVTRSDFLKDKHKPWRQGDKTGYGMRRAYLAPKGLIKHDEIPYGWELLEVYGKTSPRIQVTKGMKRVNGHTEYLNMDNTEWRHFRTLTNNDSDMCRHHHINTVSWFMKIIDRVAEHHEVNLSEYGNRSTMPAYVKDTNPKVIGA